MSNWVRLHDLRGGAMFETRDGVRAVKSASFFNGDIDCVLLNSGEYVSFGPDHNDTLVQEIDLDEVERLRARVARLEAVVAALPRCLVHLIRPAASCDQAATVDDIGPVCDRHISVTERGDRLLVVKEYPYAAALRALEEP